MGLPLPFPLPLPLQIWAQVQRRPERLAAGSQAWNTTREVRARRSASPECVYDHRSAFYRGDGCQRLFSRLPGRDEREEDVGELRLQRTKQAVVSQAVPARSADSEMAACIRRVHELCVAGAQKSFGPLLHVRWNGGIVPVRYIHI